MKKSQEAETRKDVKGTERSGLPCTQSLRKFRKHGPKGQKRLRGFTDKGKGKALFHLHVDERERENRRQREMWGRAPIVVHRRRSGCAESVSRVTCVL